MGIRTLARNTGIDRGHLSRVERGLAGLGDDNLGRVAEALRVDLTDIVHATPTPQEMP